MGDLYSDQRDHNLSDGLNTDLVQELATKIVTYSAHRHCDYRKLCIDNLLGDHIGPPYVAQIEPTVVKTLPDGTTAALISDEAELSMIFKWRKGIFSDDDKKFAAEFRKRSRDTTLNDNREQLKVLRLKKKPYSLNDIYFELKSTMSTASNQYQYIEWYCKRLELVEDTNNLIAQRYKQKPENFEKFAPYAFYCCLVDMVFYWGISYDFVKTAKKSKSHIDLEYVYYFPFVRAFSSNDKFHAAFWKVFGNFNQQSYLPGDKLSEELQSLKERWESSSEIEKQNIRKTLPYPPLIENSLIFQIYEQMGSLGVIPSRSELANYLPPTRTKAEEQAEVERHLRNYNFLKVENTD